MWQLPKLRKDLLKFCNKTYLGNRPLEWGILGIIPIPKKGIRFMKNNNDIFIQQRMVLMVVIIKLPIIYILTKMVTILLVIMVISDGKNLINFYTQQFGLTFFFLINNSN